MVVPLQFREKLHRLENAASIGKPEGEAILAQGRLHGFHEWLPFFP